MNSVARKSIERILAVVIVLCVSWLGVRAQQQPPESPELNKPIERTLSAKESHSYAITLNSGQFAHILVDQQGVDVVVIAYAPDGAKIVQVDSPNFNHGLEPISLMADVSGVYRVEVRSQTTRSGRYELRLAELRVATQNDRNRVAAQKLSVEAKALRNLKTKESHQEAIGKYQSALATWRALDDELLEAFTLHELGLLYGDIGQYQKALDSYEQAGTLYKTLKVPRGEASIISNTGWVFGELGDNEKSLEMYLREEEAYRTIGDVDAVLLSNIGSSYAKLKQFDRALEYHLRVFEIRRALPDLRHAITLNNIGNCYYHLGDRSKSLDFYNRALKLMRLAGDDYYTPTTLNHLGVFYRSSGEHEKAATYFNEAAKLRRTVGDRRNLAVTLSDLARLERDRGNLVEARKQIEEALKLVEGLRIEVASPRLRATYFAAMQQYRELYIDVLMRLNENEAAFEVSERGRARSLLESLREASTEIRHGVDPALLERERTLSQSLSARAESQMRLLSKEHSEQQAIDASKEIAALTTDYEQVQARIRTMSPQYAALTQPAPLSLREIQKQALDPDTLLLHYSLGEEKSFVWTITPDSIKTHQLPNRATIETLARQVYESLVARNRNTQETLDQRRQRLELADANYAKGAATLSQMLLGPVAAELKNKRLLIVADGVLQFVPFAGLPDPVATDARALIVDHEIANAPSASVVALLRNETANRKPAAKAVAVLADPVFSTNDPRVASDSAHVLRSANESGLSNLRRLRFSRQEADEIARLAAKDLNLRAVGFEANRDLATSAAMGQYRIVHFATHGIINNRHPELSGIVLSLVDQKGRSQNGFLRLYDLYNLKLSAELVVLSACQTALGKEIKGEGLVGLTRGFMYAGAPRVVASLWQIDDRASAEFMKRFYQGMLSRQLRPAAALRAAQISMQNDPRWRSPHYWAAFTLQGEWR